MTFTVIVSDTNGNNQREVGRVSSREPLLAYEHALRKYPKQPNEVFTIRRRTQGAKVVHYRQGANQVQPLCITHPRALSLDMIVTSDIKRVTCFVCLRKLGKMPKWNI
jgi:hypothetical protein